MCCKVMPPSRWSLAAERSGSGAIPAGGNDPARQADDNPALTALLQTLRALPETFASPEEAAVACRPLAPHAPEDELRHWMTSALALGTDGRWRWRFDPVFRVPGPPGRLNAEPDVFTERLARVTCPILLVVGAESFLLDSAERIAACSTAAHPPGALAQGGPHRTARQPAQ